MTVYLAGTSAMKKTPEKLKGVNVLESFFYIKPWQAEMRNQYKRLILDSGAFTFMSKKANDVDFETYTKQYAKFVNDYDIELFFELDIDSVVPWQRYLDLRKMLEDLTGKDPIPVFHKKRGKEWFQNAVREHSYVAVGGIVTGEIKRSEFRTLGWFINEAHKNKCKIHGLGFTTMKWLSVLKWDSVDSTTWTNGTRYGEVQWFTGRKIARKANTNQLKLKSAESITEHNLNEWVKFSEYMETQW